MPSFLSPLLPIAVLTLAFFALHGGLWVARPSEGLWLLGAVALTVLWGIAFMRLITRKAAK